MCYYAQVSKLNILLGEEESEGLLFNSVGALTSLTFFWPGEGTGLWSVLSTSLSLLLASLLALAPLACLSFFFSSRPWFWCL